MKKLFPVPCVVIEMKPCALFPLLLSICGKRHAPAAPGKLTTSGSELVGLHQVWGSLPTALVPHSPRPALPQSLGGLSRSPGCHGGSAEGMGCPVLLAALEGWPKGVPALCCRSITRHGSWVRQGAGPNPSHIG